VSEFIIKGFSLKALTGVLGCTLKNLTTRTTAT
jgi:hypothetical protein